MTLTRRLQLVGCSTEDDWMTTALKVAFATSDRQHVDQHFGAAQAFAIYALDQDQACFVEASEFGRLDMEGRPEGHGNSPEHSGEHRPHGKAGLREQEHGAPVAHRQSHLRAAGPQLSASGRSEGRRRDPIVDGDPTPGGATGPSPSKLEAHMSHRRSHPRVAGPLLNASGHHEDKLAAKIAVLEGCIAVYSQAVGASAIKQLKAKGIQPVKVSPGARINELLSALQDELREGPSSWLAKAIAGTIPADPARFDQMEAEGWDE